MINKKFTINIGKKFNKLTIVDIIRAKDSLLFAICNCDCGVLKKKIRLHAVLNDVTKSCGCIAFDIQEQKNKKIKLEKQKYVGKKFNRLTIVKVFKEKSWMADCNCECGTKGKSIRLLDVVKNVVKSCGCYSTEKKKQKKVFHTEEFKLRRRLLNSARTRANKFKLPFDISLDDISIPKKCPVLGIRLFKKGGQPSANSPALDRKINEHGYVKNNIFVISHRANNLKNDISESELKNLIKYLRNNGRKN